MRRKSLNTILSDWEGPWVIADHAYEVVRRGIPDGDKLFARISEYDDYLAYVRRKEGYEPGDTLSLIAPFLIAYNLNDEFLVSVSKDNANFMAGSFEAIRLLSQFDYSLRIISTSYCQYVRYTTALVGILPRHVKCTLFSLDEYSGNVKKEDKTLVKKKVDEIIRLPNLGISAFCREDELSSKAIEAVEDLNVFFWKELPETSFREVVESVKPLGGHRKLNALKEFLKVEDADMCEAMTIGDSITDWVMLKETKEAGGFAVSFNGNDYAVKNSNVAIISYDCMITPIIADLFNRNGLSGVEKITRQWSPRELKVAAKNNLVDPALYEAFLNQINKTENDFPCVIWITKDNLAETIEKSKKARKLVRGTAVGSLG